MLQNYYISSVNINYFSCAEYKKVRIMKQDLLEILVDIFKSSGYNVIISSQCDILVEKNGHQAYVRCTLQPNFGEIKDFSEKVGDCTGIYVMTQKTSGDIIDYATELGIYLWDRDELALQIGRAVLVNMEQKSNCYSEPEISKTNETLNLLGEPASELYIESRKAEEEVVQGSYFSREVVSLQTQPLVAEVIPLEANYLPRTYEMKRDSNNPGQDEVSEPDSYEMLNIQSVEPKISKDQVLIIAKPYLSNPKDAILKFVPFWKYKYNVEAEKKFRSKVLSIVAEGKGFLNALNKSREEIEVEGLGTPTRIPAVEYELKRPNVDKKLAEKLLIDLIIQENTREMRFNNLEGQAIIYEHRSIKPKPEEIELKMELVYIPVWEVKGKRNSVEINAYNAKILEEPIDEDAEFV
jgi:hypothetical protein